MTENHRIRPEPPILLIRSDLKWNRASNQQNAIAQQNSKEILQIQNSNMLPFWTIPDRSGPECLGNRQIRAFQRT